MTLADHEQRELNARYAEAVNDIQDRLDVVHRLQKLPTHAVITRSVSETLRIASSDRELYGTYYDILDGGFRVPEGDEWDVWRSVTDRILFPNFEEKIRFACLSPSYEGLWSYGDVAWALREEMIAHRASLFEENSVRWMLVRDISFRDLPRLPKGYRASWAARGTLCATKLATKLEKTHTDADLSALLLVNGGHPERDLFVEVHIYGPISSRTIRRITLRPDLDNGILRDFLKEKSLLFGFEVAP